MIYGGKNKKSYNLGLTITIMAYLYDEILYGCKKDMLDYFQFIKEEKQNSE